MDWTPEQIAAAAEGYVRWLTGEDSPLTKWDRDVATAVLSAVDLSDHDRAVAADALRQAADDLSGAATVGDELRIAGWLRARAEAVTDE